MKLSAISNNQSNFKGVYSQKGAKFSESQLRTIENIKNTLGERQESEDFFVGHGKNNSVSLTKVLGLRKLGIGIESSNVTYKTQYEIGSYDEEHPFKIEDLKDGYKKWSSDMNFLTLIILVPIVGFLLPFFIGMKNPKVGAEQLNKNKIEILDTLKSNLSKDTLNLTKRFVK